MLASSTGLDFALPLPELFPLGSFPFPFPFPFRVTLGLLDLLRPRSLSGERTALRDRDLLRDTSLLRERS